MRMLYTGRDLMKLSGYGFQLFHGVHYNVELCTLRNRKIRMTVDDGAFSTTGMYKNMDEFGKDWCWDDGAL